MDSFALGTIIDCSGRIAGTFPLWLLELPNSSTLQATSTRRNQDTQEKATWVGK
jgi:hypothetical protein